MLNLIGWKRAYDKYATDSASAFESSHHQYEFAPEYVAMIKVAPEAWGKLNHAKLFAMWLQANWTTSWSATTLSHALCVLIDIHIGYQVCETLFHPIGAIFIPGCLP